jgi:pyruvate formate lyase activating enzyme
LTCAQWTDQAFTGFAVTEGTVLRLERFAIHDGPGIRTTVFLKGCPLRCAWCHSPESQDPDPEFMPLPDRCIRCGACTGACPQHAVRPAADAATVTPAGCTMCGNCAGACPSGARELVGYRTSVDALVALLVRDRVFYDESGGGVTFSGGEPLLQPEFLIEAVDACRDSGLHVAVDTCGLGDTAALLDVARAANLFLFDLKIMDEDRHRAFTGASNARILYNLERLAAVHRQVVVRFPLIPGVNDDDDNVRAMGAFLASLKLTRIDVLPYHRAGLAKYHRLRRPYPLPDTQPPAADVRMHASRLLEECGLIVRPGGAS